MNSATLSIPFEFSGKAGTLEQLAPLLTTGRVLPLQRFSAGHWRREPEAILASSRRLFAGEPLIVRSSCVAEDQDSRSGAGVYDSIANVRGHDALAAAIDGVVASYGDASDADEVLVQPMATNVLASGVAMTCDPETGLPYYVIDYTLGEGTDGVTAGSEAVHSYVALKSAHRSEPLALRGLFALLDEIERLTQRDDLDVEFAVTTAGLVLFQVRPMTGTRSGSITAPVAAELHATLATEAARIAGLSEAVAPTGVSAPALFGLMPDWNPAEMIGVKPRPLAFSLYKELITDVNWASARFRYGYRDMRDKQLMFQFCGSPYVCIPHSVESFVPAALPQNVVGATVAACCEHLAENQHLHDKVEFAVIPTCFTPSLDQTPAEAVAAFAGLTARQHELYLSELRHVTEHIVSPDGPFFSDLSLVPRIEQRVLSFSAVAGSEDALQRFRGALSGAKVVGEVFAGAARAAFVATAIVKSLEELQRVPTGFTDALIGSANTIGRRLSDDFRLLSKDAFLSRHGHVRPGTYDIRMSRYDEAPDSYFDWSSPLHRSSSGDEVRLIERSTISTIQQTFEECGLQIPAAQFLDFVVAAVGAREKVKYLYGAFVSEALKSLTGWGNMHGLSREDLSFTTLIDLASGAENVAVGVIDRLDANKKRWALTQNVRTPVIICAADDLAAHEVQICNPNYITRASAEADVVVLAAQREAPSLEGRIVLIESADPGFDWIFTRRIAGFITAYGGENSHMSIRAREFGIPAAIGVGEAKFRTLSLANRLNLDCAERRIQVLA